MLTFVRQFFDINPRLGFIVSIAFLISILFAIVLHELGHGWMAYFNGDLTAKMNGRLSLNPLKHLDPIGALLMVVAGFGWAKPVPIDPRNFKNYKKGMILTSLAGVMMNFIVAFIAAACLAIYFAITKNVQFVPNSAGYYFNAFIVYLLLLSIIFNSTLIAFNLLPIYPLDGFRIVETLARPDNKYVNFMYRYGSFVLLGLLLLSSILGRITPALDIFGQYIYFVRNIIVKLFSLMFNISIL